MKELINIQNELKAPKNQRNNFGKYNYRSCEDILEALKPLLKKYECCLNITDEVINVGDLIFIESTAQLINKDKDVVNSNAQAGINPNRKGMDIAQSFGSSSSYARKYALNGLFLIDDTKDVDSIEKPTDSVKIDVSKEEKQLKECKTIEDLGSFYKSLPKNKQTLLAKLATDLKLELTKK